MIFTFLSSGISLYLNTRSTVWSQSMNSSGWSFPSKHGISTLMPAYVNDCLCGRLFRINDESLLEIHYCLIIVLCFQQCLLRIYSLLQLLDLSRQVFHFNFIQMLSSQRHFVSWKLLRTSNSACCAPGKFRGKRGGSPVDTLKYQVFPRQNFLRHALFTLPHFLFSNKSNSFMMWKTRRCYSHRAY